MPRSFAKTKGSLHLVSEPGFAPSLSPRFAAYVRDYLMDREVNPGPIFEACDINFNNSEEYDRPLPVEQVAKLFQRAAEVTSNPFMGLSMGQDFHYESSSLLIVAMVAAPSVGEGLAFLNAYDQYIDTAIKTDFQPGYSPAQFSADLLHEAGSGMVQLNDYLMGFLVQTLNVATRSRIPLLEVTFQHKKPNDISELQGFFNCQLTFESEHNSIRFHPKFLNQPFLTSNKLLFRILASAMETYFSLGDEHQGFVSTVCRHIMLQESMEYTDSESIAQRLQISPRTLRRKLAEQGYTFQEAKNLARERRAKFLLANSKASLTDIAFELGYSELSAFSRAFRSWVGETPQSYRESIKALLQ